MDDDTLAARARRGDRRAFEQLYDRHAAGTWRLSNVVHHTPSDARFATADAFATTLAPPAHPTLTATRVRLELLAATRASTEGGGPVHQAASTVDDRSDAEQRARTSFDSLPEQWRTVLWLRLVEDMDAGDAAVVVDLRDADAAALLDRALAGWRGVATEGLGAAAPTVECRRTLLLLQGYMDEGLSGRDHSRVRRHLDRCDTCRAGLEELDDLAPLLRAGQPPLLPVGLRAEALQAWIGQASDDRGPFGLLLPGGRAVPAWAERALAGAAAAVIALGITAAALNGGRGGRTDGERVTLVPADDERGAPDGESALGDVPSSPEATPPKPPTTDQPDPAPSPGATNPAAAGPQPEQPRALRPTSPESSAPAAPTAPPSADPPAPPGPGPSPAPTPTAAPAITIRIDGDTGVSVGQECTGVELLGTIVGCDPADASILPPVLPGLGL